MQYRNNNTKNRRRYKSRYKTDHNYKTKKSVKTSRTAVLVGVTTFIVLACLIVVFVFGDSIFNFFDNSFRHITATPDEQSQTIGVSIISKNNEIVTKDVPTTDPNAPTEATESTQGFSDNQPDNFIKLCKAASVDYKNSDSEQYIFVACKGSECKVSTYMMNDDGVFEEYKKDVKGYISPDGTAENIAPYEDYTPLGNYNIEYGFGTDYDPGTFVDYLHIESGSKWVTDPNSINYNKWMDPDATVIDFDTFINLQEYTVSFKQAIVFDYNRDPVDNTKGCAKFLHISDKPTEYGGIGVSETDLSEILMWLHPTMLPKICIFNE